MSNEDIYIEGKEWEDVVYNDLKQNGFEIYRIGVERVYTNSFLSIIRTCHNEGAKSLRRVPDFAVVLPRKSEAKKLGKESIRYLMFLECKSYSVNSKNVTINVDQLNTYSKEAIIGRFIMIVFAGDKGWYGEFAHNLPKLVAETRYKPEQLQITRVRGTGTGTPYHLIPKSDLMDFWDFIYKVENILLNIEREPTINDFLSKELNPKHKERQKAPSLHDITNKNNKVK